MNFARSGAGELSARKWGRVLRKAMATTASEGTMPGRMVRNQEPKDAHTSWGTVVASASMMPWAMSPMDEAVVGGKFPSDGVAVGGGLAV